MRQRAVRINFQGILDGCLRTQIVTLEVQCPGTHRMPKRAVWVLEQTEFGILLGIFVSTGKDLDA